VFDSCTVHLGYKQLDDCQYGMLYSLVHNYRLYIGTRYSDRILVFVDMLQLYVTFPHHDTAQQARADAAGLSVV